MEPAILSLFCAELDKKRIERNLKFISEDLIGEFGENILKDFYLNSIKELSSDKVEFLEEGLLTDDGFRDNIALQNVKNHGFTNEEITNLPKNIIIENVHFSDSLLVLSYYLSQQKQLSQEDDL